MKKRMNYSDPRFCELIVPVKVITNLNNYNNYNSEKYKNRKNKHFKFKKQAIFCFK